MSLIDELKNLGIDTEEALGRFMGNASLYERMLGKLTSAVNDNVLKPAIMRKLLQKRIHLRE